MSSVNHGRVGLVGFRDDVDIRLLSNLISEHENRQIWILLGVVLCRDQCRIFGTSLGTRNPRDPEGCRFPAGRVRSIDLVFYLLGLGSKFDGGDLENICIGI